MRAKLNASYAVGSPRNGGNPSAHSDEITVRGDSGTLNIQFVLNNEKDRAREIDVHIGPKAFPVLIKAICDAHPNAALEAMSAEMAMRIKALPNLETD